MKIQCVSNSAARLPDVIIDPETGFPRSLVFALTVGKQYVVYGMTVYRDHLWYYICDEQYTYYPIWNPSPLFEIVDSRLSVYWRVGLYRCGADRNVMSVIAFDEWVSDPFYYDKLTDGDPAAVATFRKYKALIDDEAR
jgi:hypothetical protein